MSRLLWPSIVMLAVLAHLVPVLYFVPPSLLFSDVPLSGDDFDTHINQTWSVLEGLEGWGRTWVYDTQLLAGIPTGAIFDADNKGWTLWTFALTKLGMSRGLAFNMFVLAVHAAVPLVAYASARLFRLARWAALLAAALASLGWLFDSFLHWAWWVGMVSYAFASYLAVLPLALFFRQLEDRRPLLAFAVAPALGLCHLVHPYTFWILAVPMIALYMRSFRSLTRREHVAVLAIAIVVVGMNAFWIGVAIEFWHYILDSSYYAQAGLDYLVADFFGILRNPSDTGVLATRSGFRFLFFAAAIVMLFVWRRDGDRRLLPFAAGLIALLSLAYLGGYTKVVAQIQPYRHVAPALFLSVIPAAALVETIHRRRLFNGLPKLAYAVLGIVAIPAVQHLARDVQYFTPLALPDVPPLIDGSPTGLSASGYPPHLPYQFPHGLLMVPRHEAMLDWVREHDDGQSRFAVELDWFGDRMAWATDAQVMGGFRERNLEHAHANLFRQYPRGKVPEPDLRAYLERYGVKYLIISGIRRRDFKENDTLAFVGAIQPFHVYTARFEVSLFAEGSGHVDARTNIVEVSGTDPDQDIVLRYHWLETLVCRPDCTIGREQVAGDEVGFIRIPAPHPTSFAIENGY